MLTFISRNKITKTDGHVIWYDLLKDDETGIEYFCINGNLSVRYKDINKI